MASSFAVHRSSVSSDFEEVGADTLSDSHMDTWKWNSQENNYAVERRNRVSSREKYANLCKVEERANGNSRDARPSLFRTNSKCKDSPRFGTVTYKCSESELANPRSHVSTGMRTGNLKQTNVLLGDSEEVESHDKVKTKLLSVWNNVKYGWTVRLKTNFSRDSPIWFLGQCYHRKLCPDSSKDVVASNYGIDGFKLDFMSRIWFTYRREFPTLAGSSYTTDCGWGCMLRSGQMLLAQALICHFLGRSWRWKTDLENHGDDSLHRKIVRWFGDAPSRFSPFSLHTLVAIGESSGKKAGDWYGPASVAHILKQCMEVSTKEDHLLNEVCVYVAQDCTVYKQDVLNLCNSFDAENVDDRLACSAAGHTRWKGVIILVPVRLGGEVLNPIYFKCIQDVLANEYCIGIIGGRPKHSLYFVGWQDDKFIHLDPHYCQEAVDVRSDSFPVQSFHCQSPRKLSISRMDPSCTIGFYCRTKEEVMNFLSSCQEVLTPPQGDYPIFVVADKNIDHTPFDLVQSLSCDQSFSSVHSSALEDMGPTSEDFSEFVFL